MTSANRSGSSLPPGDDVRKVLELRHGDPFRVLGWHLDGNRAVVRAFVPGAARVWLEEDLAMHRCGTTELFEWRGAPESLPRPYRISSENAAGLVETHYDAYGFAPQIPDFDLHLFNEGRHRHAHRFLGANSWTVDAIEGVLFATWAPNATRVSVVGDFNDWDGRRHAMRVRGGSGVFELFIPAIPPGSLYKFEILGRGAHRPVLKSDPYGKRFEPRPRTASTVCETSSFQWSDQDWIDSRSARDWRHAPLSIYEVHLGSWREDCGHGYRELAHALVPYVSDLGFTHVELLPVSEHPLDESWGYQTVGYFAPTSRYGGPDDFRYFVDHCHRHGVGVLLDWVPAHFPRDEHGLARFDGTALYEHEDPRLGEHRDWGTLIFNYGRNEVRGFLVASALYWLEEFHVDGLRVDAVASMLYLNYSRKRGEWLPNRYGGNENLEAIAFLRELNEVTHGSQPGTLMIAEESTAWPQVTRPTWVGGLGFSMKWNMGWMNDTLAYFHDDPVYRAYHHDRLTFGILYAFSENFVLPLSHDEVVHEKRSLLAKMPGDEWQRFANLRLLYVYLWTYPGKKLLFMGGELAERREWDVARSLDWHLLEEPAHRGVQALVGDLNRLYRNFPALHRHDFEQHGFEWIDCHDASQSVIAYERRSGDDFLVVVLNFTPVPRRDYRIGVSRPGRFREVLNSDSSHYGGSDVGNLGGVVAEPRPYMGRGFSLSLTLPPLTGLVLEPVDGRTPA